MRGALLACAMVAAWGCEGGSKGGHGPLRPGLTRVAGVPVGLGIPAIQGVARASNLMVVLYDTALTADFGDVSGAKTWYTPGVAYSRDRGVTWTQIDDLSLVMAPNGVEDRLPTGVFIRDGAVYIMTPAPAGTFGQFTHLFVERLDLESGEGELVGELPDQVVVDNDGTILWWEPGPPRWVRYDPVTASQVAEIPRAADATFMCGGPYGHVSTPSGTDVVGGCMTTNDAGAHWSYCFGGGVLGATWDPGFACAPVPSGVTITARPLFGATWGATFNLGTDTRFGWIASDGGAPTFHDVDIGPGLPFQPITDNRRGPDGDRWGGLVAVQDLERDGVVTLYRQERGPAFVATDLPTTGCPGGALGCSAPRYDAAHHLYEPTDRLLWAEPAGDAYLLFYFGEASAAAGGERDYAIVAERRPLYTGPATAGGELERACARASACEPTGVGFDIPACVGRWLDPTRSGGRDEFLAAKTCDALLALQPGLVYGCGQGGVDTCVSAPPDRCACGDGAGVSCCSGPVAACAGKPAGTNVCTDAQLMSCQSDHAIAVRDCSVVEGASCDATPGSEGCTTAASPECPSSFTPTCDGSKVRYCLFEALREVDCRALGGTCDTSAGAARCSGGIAPPTPIVTPPAETPTCDAPALTGAPIAENAVADYPSAGGGPIRDGTWVLTRFELWSAATSPYTHRETLRIAGGTFALATEHSAVGAAQSAGTMTSDGTTVTFAADCPEAATRIASYTANDTTLVLLEGATIRTFTWQP